MSTITWAEQNANLYIACNKNGMEIGRVAVSFGKTEQPFIATSANGMTKRFFVLYRAKDWVEDLYSDVADVVENEQ